MRIAPYNPRTYPDLINLHDMHECSLQGCTQTFMAKTGFVFFDWNRAGRRVFYPFCSLSCLFKAIIPAPCVKH